jgi:hypothetical protein
MRSHVNPEHAARLRAARAEEDAALGVVNARSDAVDRARARRAQALARYDSQVEDAEAELAEAIGALVHTAGLDRSALVLGMPRGALRRMLPAAKPDTASRVRPADSAGGER